MLAANIYISLSEETALEQQAVNWHGYLQYTGRDAHSFWVEPSLKKCGVDSCCCCCCCNWTLHTAIEYEMLISI